MPLLSPPSIRTSSARLLRLPRLPRLSGLAALPCPGGAGVSVERDIPVHMPDGVTLLADRYAPRGVAQAPTILVRTPYGRRGIPGLVNGLPAAFAYVGFQVVIQSVRGTYGSGGEFDPLDEGEDGLATIAWLKRQPWFDGSFAIYGASYLGYCGWATAADAGPELKAMAVSMSASQFRDAAYVGGAFALESALIWTDMTSRCSTPLGVIPSGLFASRRVARAASSGRPPAELDTLLTGAQAPFFQALLASDEPDAAFWASRDHRAAVAEVSAPVNMVGGWYDVFVPWQLKDYLALRAAGHQPYLTIGPWSHADPRHVVASLRETLGWFRAHLCGDFSGIRAEPVRLFVTGSGRWRTFADWPVPGMRLRRWHLQPGGGLGEGGPHSGPATSYRYDPADPTPALGGPSLMGGCQPVDHRPLERRPDVLVFTSAELDSPLEIVGPVNAELHVRSDREHTDFVVRLCDVAPDGTSRNVCDGGLRLRPGEPPADSDGVRRITVELWPAGHSFRRGHRVRVHVTSGAYPKLASNPGTGEPLLGGAVAGAVACQEVFHDPDRPSAIVLPVISGG